MHQAPPSRSLTIALLLTSFLAGCQQDDEVRHYTAPRPEERPPSVDAAEKVAQRLLGAIFTRGDSKWFVKFVGPEATVKEHVDEFNAFVESFRFTGGAKPIEWKEPPGWKAGKGTQFSIGAYRVGPDDASANVTVTPAAGGTLDNVNRWRGQLGLPPMSDADFTKSVQEKKVGDATVLLVDLTGVGSGKMSGMPPFAGKMPPMAKRNAPAAPQVKYTLPDGWKAGKQTQFSVAAFRAGEGNDAVDITVTVASGALLLNVNRWRGQLGLKEWSQEQFGKEAKTLMIAGSPAAVVDLISEGAGERKRIVAAVLVQNEQSWFFKMTGLADPVGKQKDAFEAFVKSVRLEGEGEGGNAR